MKASKSKSALRARFDEQPRQATMERIALSHNLAASFLCAISFVGGAAMTKRMVSSDAALATLQLGGGWLTVGVAGLVWLWRKSGTWAIAHQMFIALFGIVGLLPTVFVLALPLLWIHGAQSIVGARLIGYFFAMLAYQLQRANEHFIERWAANQRTAMEALYDPTLGSINVEPLQRELQVKADLFLPVRSDIFKTIASCGLVLSMLVGFNLRKVYPESSAFAWGGGAQAGRRRGCHRRFAFGQDPRHECS